MFCTQLQLELDKIPEDKVDERRELTYQYAQKFIKEKNKVSVTKIRRALHIGYHHAAMIVKRLEDDKLISKPTLNGKREVM